MTSVVEQIIVEYLGDTSDLENASSDAEDALDGVEKKARKTGDNISKSLKNIEFAVVVEMIANVAEKSFEVGKAIGTWWQKDQREEFLADLEAMKALNDDISDNVGKQNREVITDIKMMDNPEDQFKAFDDAIFNANNSVTVMKNRLNSATKEMEDMAPTWKSLWQAGSEGVEYYEGNVKDAKKALEQAREQVEALAEARGDLIEKQEREAEQLKQNNIKAAEELGEKYQFLIDTFGKSARQTEIFRMAQKGVGEEALAVARKLDRELTALENFKKAQEEVAKEAEHAAKEKVREAERAAKAQEREREAFEKKVNGMKSKLKEQVIELEQGEQAALAFRLAQEGITGQDAQEILNLNAKVAALEKEKEAREELKEKLKEYDRALEESNKLKDSLSGDTQFHISAVGLTSDIGKERSKAAKATTAKSMEAEHFFKQRQNDAGKTVGVNRVFASEDLAANFSQVKESQVASKASPMGSDRANPLLTKINDGIQELVTVTKSKEPMEFQEIDNLSQAGI